MRPGTRLLVLLIALGLMIASAFGADEGQGTLIILNKSDNTANLVDLENHQAVATLSTGDAPHEVAVSPDGQTAVVTNYGSRGEPGASLTVFDLQNLTVAKTIDLGDYQRPHGVVFLSKGEEVLVTVEAQKALLSVRVATGEVLEAFPTEAEVSHMVIHVPQVERAFVANIGSGSVSVIDLSTGKLVSNLATGRGAEGLDVTPDGSEVWVTNRSADTISIIDAKKLEVLTNLPCATFPIRLKFTPDGARALVSNARSGDVAVFDVEEHQEVARIPMRLDAVEGKEGRLFSDAFGDSPVPVGILVHPDGHRAYVANTNADAVAVVDLDSLKIVDLIPTGREPDGLGYTPLRLRSQAAK